MTDIIWSEGDARIALVISISTLCFLIYWFVAHAGWFREWLVGWQGADHVDAFLALYQKGVGIFFIGIVPALLAWLVLPRTVSEYGVGGAEVQLTFFWILGLGGTLPFLPYFSARREDMQAYYPQVRVREWTRGLYVINSLIWIVYLGAYEFLFRGFILTGCLQTMGLWPAIAITTAISSATHMPKGPKETFGTIPFSIILCLAMAQTGAIWAGYIVHVLLALANDYFALRFKQRTSVLR